MSPPPARNNPPPKERRALRQLWQEKAQTKAHVTDSSYVQTLVSDAIEIVPQPIEWFQAAIANGMNPCLGKQHSDVIVITPTYIPADQMTQPFEWKQNGCFDADHQGQDDQDHLNGHGQASKVEMHTCKEKHALKDHTSSKSFFDWGPQDHLNTLGQDSRKEMHGCQEQQTSKALTSANVQVCFVTPQKAHSSKPVVGNHHDKIGQTSFAGDTEEQDNGGQIPSQEHMQNEALEPQQPGVTSLSFFCEHAWACISLRGKQSTTQPQLRRSLARQTTRPKPKKTKEKKARRDRPRPNWLRDN
jgi:hypothetical protein